MGTSNKDTKTKKTTAKASTKVAAKATPKKAVKKPAANKPDLLAMKAALKAELKSEQKAEALAAKMQADALRANAAAVGQVPVAQTAQKPPVLHGGVGEVITSGAAPQPTGVHKLRPIMKMLVGGLIILVVGWLTVQYLNYHKLHSPAKQAELFKKYDDESSQLDTLHKYDLEAASLQSYLNTKPDAPYQDKATLKLANALLNANRNDEAIKQFERVEPVPSMQLDARRGLSKAYLGKGDKSRAHYYQQQVVDALKDQKNPSAGLQLVIDQVQLDATNR